MWRGADEKMTNVAFWVDDDGSADSEWGFELFKEMRFRSCHLQRPHPVRAVHVEPEAQVTPTDAGRKQAPGCHLGDVTLSLDSRVRVEEFAFAPLDTPNKEKGGK